MRGVVLDMKRNEGLTPGLQHAWALFSGKNSSLQAHRLREGVRWPARLWLKMLRMRACPSRSFLSLLLGLLVCAAGAQAQKAPTSLEAQVHAIAAEHHGDVALFAENLKTHETVAVSPDTPVQTASVIKLAILYEALEQVRSGKAHFDDKITLAKADQVQAPRVFLFFDAPLSLTLKDVLTIITL